MSNIILTVSGASFMNQAGASGPYIPIKYFVPVYDHRYDSLVHPTSALIPVSAGDFTSAVNPFGDIIWNIDALSTSSYSMSPNEYLLYDSNQSGTTTITGSRFDSTAYITLRSGFPLSDSISATSLVYNYPNWTTNGYTLVPGNNSIPTGYSVSTQKFFNTVSYAPISCAAGSVSRGLFKIRLGNQVGNFKFNKIAMYAAKILANGTEDTSVAPVLFGIAMLKEPVIKSNDGFNISFFELDVELQFSSNGYFSNVSFLNNTAWNWTGGGNNVWIDGSAILGSSAIPGSYTPNARFHIVEPNPLIPIIRITNDNDNSHVNTFLSEVFYQNEQTEKSSKPVFVYNLETSGTTNYSRIQFNIDNVNATRSFNMAFVDSTSGAINTGWFSSYGGYLETTWLKFDSNILATFRSVNNLYSTLVLGRDSENAFEHNGKFLTLHGGSLLVGSNLISGVNNITAPSLSANGYIIGANIYSKGDAIIDGDLYADDVYFSGNINAALGINYLGRTHFQTSADFHSNIKVFGDIDCTADINTVNLEASNLITTPTIWATYTALVGLGMGYQGTGGLLTCQNFGVSTSAHFKGPVTLRNNLNANTVSADMVSATNGFFSGSNKKADGYWDTYTPTITCNGSTTVTATYSNYANYTIIGKTLIISYYLSIALNNANSNAIEISLPDGKTVAVTPVVAYATPISLSIGSTDEHSWASAPYGESNFFFRRNDSSYFPASTIIQTKGQIIIALD